MKNIEREMKTMTNLENLRTATPKQIADMFCDMICGKCGKCSDACPSFLFDRCGEGKNGVLEWLNDEVNAPKDAPKNAPKDAPEDAPKGWIKLKSIVSVSDNTLYIKASKIVGVGPSAGVDNIRGKEVTAVYTTYDENDPWLVYDSADEVMGKIERA